MNVTYAVADPGTVMVEARYAAVADGAVLGAQRAPHHARRAEPRRHEPAARRALAFALAALPVRADLRQLDYSLHTTRYYGLFQQRCENHRGTCFTRLRIP